jgi:hypothetical protein
MTGLQGFALGMMVAWTPSFILFALLLWRAKTEGSSLPVNCLGTSQGADTPSGAH